MASILGSAPAPAPVQTVVAPPPPAVMPVQDDAAIQAAKKNAMIAASQRSGRLSTVLTNSDGTQAGGDKLGG